MLPVHRQPNHSQQDPMSSRRRPFLNRRQVRQGEQQATVASPSLPLSTNGSRSSRRCFLVGNFLLAILAGIGMGTSVLHWTTSDDRNDFSAFLSKTRTSHSEAPPSIHDTHSQIVAREIVSSSQDIAKTSSGIPTKNDNPIDAPSNTAQIVAYVVSITDCSGSKNSQNDLLDAASVLKHSIHLTSIQTPSSHSIYDYQMYAFLHEDAREGCATIAPALEEIGYTVEWKPTPFRLEDISDDNENAAFFKEKVHKQGCCGEREFLKLFTLQLIQYPIAVHLDLDTLLFRPVDHLYNAMLSNKLHSLKYTRAIHIYR